MDKCSGYRRRSARLAASVAVLAVVCAALLLGACASGGPVRGPGLLDSRVTCDKLGPRACDLKLSAADKLLLPPPLPPHA